MQEPSKNLLRKQGKKNSLKEGLIEMVIVLCVKYGKKNLKKRVWFKKDEGWRK